MLRVFIIAVLFISAFFGVTANGQKSSPYLFVWTGDADRKESDFLAVIDVKPKSKHYGQIITTLSVGKVSTVPHHTEHEMPIGNILFANGFAAGRTFRFDFSQPTNPRLLDSFVVTGDYMHPHSFVRLPNGNVLSTLQMRGHRNEQPGALVELDPKGNVVRIADASDEKVEKFIRPYSLAVVSVLDRVIVTSADMHEKDMSHVVQVWRLSDFKLLKSIYLTGVEGVDPAEPRLLSDGRTVLVSTFTCGLYQIVNLEGENPSAEFVHRFGGKNCALPVVAGNFWIQTVPDSRALVSLDVSNPSKPVEVSRLTLGEKDKPHWIALEPNGKRIVISGGGDSLESRLLIANIDSKNGKLSLDEAFREKGAKQMGINFDRENWKHGKTGRAIPHGAVFSRP